MPDARIRQLFEGTRYLDRMLELLGDAECTVEATDSSLLIYRNIAGAKEVIRIELAAGDGLGHLPRARLFIAEVPDDAPFREMTALLLAHGFHEEARIDHFVAAGIALSFFRNEPALLEEP